VEDKGEMQDTREWLREDKDSGKVEREKDRELMLGLHAPVSLFKGSDDVMSSEISYNTESTNFLFPMALLKRL
jgi:hypothetical protein